MILVLFSYLFKCQLQAMNIMNYFILPFCHWLMVDCSRLVRLAVLLRKYFPRCSFHRESSEVFSWYLGTKSYIFRL